METNGNFDNVLEDLDDLVIDFDEKKDLSLLYKSNIEWKERYEKVEFDLKKDADKFKEFFELDDDNQVASVSLLDAFCDNLKDNDLDDFYLGSIEIQIALGGSMKPDIKYKFTEDNSYKSTAITNV